MTVELEAAGTERSRAGSWCGGTSATASVSYGGGYRSSSVMTMRMFGDVIRVP